MTTTDNDRRGAMLSLAATLPKATRKLLGRHGLAEGGIVGDWESIVGPLIGERSLPLRLAFTGGERRDGTLHVRVEGALALELQHLEPQIVERINGHFGYRAVARIKILQGPVPRRQRPAPTLRPLLPADATAVDAAVAEVGDDALRRALAGLGQSLRRAKVP